MPKPTEDEARNGWASGDLAAYLAERAEATAGRDGQPLAGGNVVTPWLRPRPMPRIENTTAYDPLKW